MNIELILFQRFQRFFGNSPKIYDLQFYLKLEYTRRTGTRGNMSLEEQHNHQILIYRDAYSHHDTLEDELFKFNCSCNIAYSLEQLELFIKKKYYDLLIVDLDSIIDYTKEEFLSKIRKVTLADIVLYVNDSKQIDYEVNLEYKVLDYFIKDTNLFYTAQQIKILLDRITTNSGLSILMIDDTESLTANIKPFLELRNYIVYGVNNIQDGLFTMENYEFDLVVLNVNDIKGDGLLVLEFIRKKFQSNMMPVLILDERNDQSFYGKLYKMGVSNIQKKNISYEALILNIDYWIDYYKNMTKLIDSQNLLKEYKETVDVSNIVSKTNPKGKITYVNEQFCEISGYSSKELLGNAHNIVRHPDTPTELFKDMWKTIKSKQTWKGKVKNLAKDGSVYYVDTTIKPLLDKQGNIIEYISVRKNITELEHVKQYLENELISKEDCLIETMKRSSEYHRAMDESTILARTDLDGIITYINKEFTEILGYESDDVVGKDHTMMKHPNTSKVIIQNLWDTILQGQTWKGMIQNISKSGETIWLDTTIVPIKNMHEDIVEFLTIRHNVSEIIHLHEEIRTTQGELIYTLGAAVETRSRETGNHIKRVASYSKLLARLIGYDEKEAEILFQASPLHDIGKLGIPDHILKKPAKLTADEWEVMKTHSELGYQILNNSTRSILKAAAIVAYEHHEKWNGKGYPRGLKGEEIHIYGRITAIADVFDALGSDRCYKKAWNDEDIFEYFTNERGEHFDPKLIDLFFENKDQFLKIRETYKD